MKTYRLVFGKTIHEVECRMNDYAKVGYEFCGELKAKDKHIVVMERTLERRLIMRHLFVVMLALALAGCFHEGGDTEVSPVEEMPAVVEYPCPPLDRGDWTLLVELPRQNLYPEKFRMVDEWADPIMEAYVDGKDFLFVIFKPGVVLQDGTRTLYHIHSARYYLEAPGLLDLPTQFFHFPDPDGHWFLYWGHYSSEANPDTGFTVSFDTTPVDIEIDRKYFYRPQFGTSFDGYAVGDGPEIKAGWVLRIYTR